MASMLQESDGQGREGGVVDRVAGESGPTVGADRRSTGSVGGRASPEGPGPASLARTRGATPGHAAANASPVGARVSRGHGQRVRQAGSRRGRHAVQFHPPTRPGRREREAGPRPRVELSCPLTTLQARASGRPGPHVPRHGSPIPPPRNAPPGVTGPGRQGVPAGHRPDPPPNPPPPRPALVLAFAAEPATETGLASPGGGPSASGDDQRTASTERGGNSPSATALVRTKARPGRRAQPALKGPVLAGCQASRAPPGTNPRGEPSVGSPGYPSPGGGDRKRREVLRRATPSGRRPTRRRGPNGTR